ncbi:sensor histidine kinase, partial [Micromonospora zhanjiangensis]
MSSSPAPAERNMSPLSRGIGWLIGVVWLFYLGQPIGTAWHHPPGVGRTVSLVALAAFALCYVLLFTRIRRIWRAGQGVSASEAWLFLAGLTVLAVSTIPATGGDWLVTLVYVGTAAVLVLPTRVAALVVVLLAAVPVVSPLAVPAWAPDEGVAFAILLAAFAIHGVKRLNTRNNELIAAQAEIHRLAVAGERARTARDLHDILGHSLTVIAVKAELAGRLLEVDPRRAAVEIADLERLSREALADVRTTVGAYREVNLDTELASARTALCAAGIAAELPPTVGELPPERSELFGWAVREAVTNVVRHSGASRCVIGADRNWVEVTDDGAGDRTGGNGGSDGHGLIGMRERAALL